jgi:hypothetical protein
MTETLATGRYNPRNGPFRTAILLIAIILALAGLTACGLFSDDERDPLKTNDGEMAQPPAPDKSILKQPPTEGNFTVSAEPPQTGGNTNGLQPPRGINAKRLFSESIRDEDKRFERLETAVQSIRDDFDTMAPSIRRLEAVEGDIQELVGQLETLLKNEGATPAPVEEIQTEQLNNDPAAIKDAMGVADQYVGQTAQATAPPAALVAPTLKAPALQQPAQNPMTAPPPLPKTTPPPPPENPVAQTDGAPLSLANIRMSDTGGKTRIVIETRGKLDYAADLDNDEKILTLMFDRGSLGFDPSNASTRSKLIKSVSGTPQDGGGFVLAFTLNKSTNIAGRGAIAPNADNPNNRIFIDLAN